MTPNPLLGVLFHWLGGFASASFYVPFRGVKRWNWEIFWLTGGLFSWVGAASDGGYIGADISTFTSSIISAAPGTVVVVLMYDAGILAPLTIQRR